MASESAVSRPVDTWVTARASTSVTGEMAAPAAADADGPPSGELMPTGRANAAAVVGASSGPVVSDASSARRTRRRTSEVGIQLPWSGGSSARLSRTPRWAPLRAPSTRPTSTRATIANHAQSR